LLFDYFVLVSGTTALATEILKQKRYPAKIKNQQCIFILDLGKVL